MKVAIAKRVDLKARIEHGERKFSEVQNSNNTDDQITMTEDRIKKLRDEQIDILKGEASKQVYQIKESITKFLDKETGTLGERIRTLFKEQGITIMFILTAVGTAVGVLIQALLGGSTASTNKSGNNSGDGGAREWINKTIESCITIIR